MIDNFKSAYGAQTTVRWNPFSGSPDVMTGFHTAPSTETPENTAWAFVNQNNALFGTDAASLKLVSSQEALGGYLLRFQQQANGVDVVGGIGFLLNSNKQFRMVMGSTFRGVNVSNGSVLDGAAAAARAAATVAQFAVSRPANVEALRTPAFDEIAKQLAPALRAPRLNIFPTADGYRLAWNVLTFSRNPFGVFVSQVDAETGNILSRESLVHYQSADMLPYQADIFPNHPTLKNPDTGELLKDAGGIPVGMERVQLRGFNPGTNATGVAGTISGTLDALPNGGAAPDLDFELLDDQGHVLQTSGNLGPNEQVGGAVTPGKTYIYRVVGYASGPCQFTITSEQYINTTATGPNSNGGSSGSSSFLPAITGVSTPAHLVRFTVNPLTKAVTFKVLK